MLQLRCGSGILAAKGHGIPNSCQFSVVSGQLRHPPSLLPPSLLRSYGAPVSDGRVVLKAEDAKNAAGELDGPLWVVKAQIHAGGRGKAGGVKLVKSKDEIREFAEKWLGKNLVIGFSRAGNTCTITPTSAESTCGPSEYSRKAVRSSALPG